MASQYFSLMHTIRLMAGAYRDEQRTDAELLSCYAATHNQPAFTTLMVRHGPMVWNICRMVLGNEADAEDAYQLTFIALAKRAAQIRVKDTLAGWLCHVARQSALNRDKARISQRRLHKSLQAQACLEAKPQERATDENETKGILCEALAELPEKHRIVLVLYYMEGKTLEEIAEILGVEKQSIWTRLARGKIRLQERLTSRGLVLGTAALAGMLEQAASHAAMPPGLVTKTFQAATAFRTGNLKGGLAKLAKELLTHAPVATPWWKSAWMLTILCVGSLGVGVGGVAWRVGLFRTKADGPARALNRALMQPSDKQKPTFTRLDAYGDPLPVGALARLGTVRFRQNGTIGPDCKVTVTANKKLFTSGIHHNENYSLHCYDLTTGTEIRQFRDAMGQVIQLDPDAALSFDGNLLAQKLAPDGNYAFWNMTQGKPLSPKIGSRPDAMAMSRDGKNVAALIRIPDTNGFALSVWDNVLEKPRWTKKDKRPLPVQIAYTNDGKILMGACPALKQLIVRRWEAATGNEVVSWKIMVGSDISFKWSHDGSTLAVSPKSPGDRISLWDMKTGKEIRQVQVDGRVDMAYPALSNDGKVLAYVTAKGEGYNTCFSLGLWDTQTGKLLRHYDMPTNHCCLSISPDGSSLVIAPIGEAFIQVWEIESGKLINQLGAERGHKSAPVSLVFSNRGETLSSASPDDLFFWSTESVGGEYSIRARTPFPKKCTWGHPGRPTTLSPDGKTAAYYDGKQVRIWNAATSQELKGTPGPSNGVCRHAAFSPNGNIFAMSNVGLGVTSIRLYHLSTGEWHTGLAGENFAFSPNGKYMAMGPVNKNVCLWDPVAHKTIGQAFVGDADCLQFAFSPDGDTLAVSGPLRGTCDAIYLYRICTEGPNVRLQGPRLLLTAPLGTDYSLTFSPDGKTFASTQSPNWSVHASNAVIHLWETVTGKARYDFNKHGRMPTSIAFAPDGRKLASAHTDSTILIWDVTGRLRDGKLASAPLTEELMASLWADLASTDTRRAGRAVWTLAAASEATVAYLKTRLQPVSTKVVSAEAMSKHIIDLSAEVYTVRRKATLELKKLGYYAEPALREALKMSRSLELRSRVKYLLDIVEEGRILGARSEEEIRAVRAIEVLGNISSNKARQMLETLSLGDAGARLTQEAQTGLEYWKRAHQSR